MVINTLTGSEFKGLVAVLKPFAITINEIQLGSYRITDNFSNNEFVYNDTSVEWFEKYGRHSVPFNYYEVVIFFMEMPFEQIPLHLSSDSTIGVNILKYRLKIGK